MTTRGAAEAGRAFPARLGKYSISGVLGEGAMGTVYRARDPVIEREVAIKTIRKALLGADSGIDDAAARFRNEARAVGRLSHPGIVAIYEYFEDETTAFIAMEFVQGRNLAEVLAGPAAPLRDEALIVRILDQLLTALACAHAHGVWHRDVKPANLIVTPNGQVKLTDFGIARIESAALTQVGSAIGTPGYMAPEQYIGEAIDHRVDLFAAGVLLYRLLTGAMPFAGAPETVMYKTLGETALPPSRVAGSIGDGRYDALVASALQKDPGHRFADAGAMRQALLDASAAAPPAEASDATVIVPSSRPTTTPGAASWAAVAPVRSPTARLAALAAEDSGARPTVGSSDGGHPAQGPGAAASAPPSGAGSGTLLHLPGWDPAVLKSVEQALTRFVGPIARVLVRQTAAGQTGLPQLLSALSTHIPGGDAEQRRFRALCGDGAESTTSRAAPLASASPTLASSSRTIATGRPPEPVDAGMTPPTEQMAETARHLLATHIGPIARVIVKRVLATNPTRAEFAERLAAQASDGSNQERLLVELRQALG